MYRTTMRSASRPVIASLRSNTIRAAPRRFNSTATPADKSRSWKSSVARLGLAFGAVYYYNTSPIFADEAICALQLMLRLRDYATNIEQQKRFPHPLPSPMMTSPPLTPSSRRSANRSGPRARSPPSHQNPPSLNSPILKPLPPMDRPLP